MKNSGIYKITNNINSKIYIGQSINIRMRWRYHKAPSHWRDNASPLYKAIKKYGIENFSFEVLEEIEPTDREKLDEREHYWIEYYDSANLDKGYNLTLGGQSYNNINERLFSSEDVIDIRSKKIQYYSPQYVYKQYKEKASEITFRRVWEGNSYSEIMPEIYEDRERLKYIEKVLKTRGQLLSQSNFTIDMILDIRQMKKEGVKRKDILSKYSAFQIGEIDRILYNKTFIEINDNNLKFIEDVLSGEMKELLRKEEDNE